MYLYETHLHTYPVSRCAGATVREVLEFYKKIGFAGVFITNHFLDGNINVDASLPYEERMRFYLSDYEEACRLADEVGISVFFGVEHSYKGTDFLVYGLTPLWYLAHPEIEDMKKSKLLPFLMEEGALVIQAHPFRGYLNCQPAHLLDGVEVNNANPRHDSHNDRALAFAQANDLLFTSGSDVHELGDAGSAMMTCPPFADIGAFARLLKDGRTAVTLEA